MIHVHGFETSNNVKVRIALGYKGLDYEFHRIDPADRSGIVRLSGQHLTPVLVHDGTVLFDSAAILRWLDANFRDTPRLFGANLLEQWAIEDEELFARAVLAAPLMTVVHRRVAGNPLGPEELARCADDWARAVRRLAARLDGREWLVGHSMSAADITAAAVLDRVQRAGLFDDPPEAPSLADWRDRVLAWDRYHESRDG
ncbi:MAG: hypothetical protein Kow0062_00120 [Acidobacteriota bacterium]